MYLNRGENQAETQKHRGPEVLGSESKPLLKCMCLIHREDLFGSSHVPINLCFSQKFCCETSLLAGEKGKGADASDLKRQHQRAMISTYCVPLAVLST